MKKVLIIIMVLYANIAFSQKANPWSLEIGASTYNYVFYNNLPPAHNHKHSETLGVYSMPFSILQFI